VTDLSMESTTTSTLHDASSVIVKAIAGGHLPSVAEAIVKQTELADMIFQLFLDQNVHTSADAQPPFHLFSELMRTNLLHFNGRPSLMISL